MCSQGSTTFEDLSQIQTLESPQPSQDECTTAVTESSQGSHSTDGLPSQGSANLFPSQMSQDAEGPVESSTAEKEFQISRVRVKPDIAAAFPAACIPPLPPGVVRVRPIARAYTTAAAPPMRPPTQMQEDAASQQEAQREELDDAELAAEQEAARSLMLLGDAHAPRSSAGAVPARKIRVFPGGTLPGATKWTEPLVGKHVVLCHASAAELVCEANSDGAGMRGGGVKEEAAGGLSGEGGVKGDGGKGRKAQQVPPWGHKRAEQAAAKRKKEENLAIQLKSLWEDTECDAR
ncbi:hypothetical protein T484DRAFT_1750468 [Baffinella frigidus]|nr:hypothetical protein T484DRAFT_1750468 [Cryptophyta sp. CCMP2293]